MLGCGDRQNFAGCQFSVLVVFLTHGSGNTVVIDTLHATIGPRDVAVLRVRQGGDLCEVFPIEGFKGAQGELADRAFVAVDLPDQTGHIATCMFVELVPFICRHDTMGLGIVWRMDRHPFQQEGRPIRFIGSGQVEPDVRVGHAHGSLPGVRVEREVCQFEL